MKLAAVVLVLAVAGLALTPAPQQAPPALTYKLGLVASAQTIPLFIAVPEGK